MINGIGKCGGQVLGALAANIFFFFFFNQIYCARGTVSKLHIKAEEGVGGAYLNQALIKPSETMRAISVLSPHPSVGAA